MRSKVWSSRFATRTYRYIGCILMTKTSLHSFIVNKSLLKSAEDKFAVGSSARLISVCYFEKENDWSVLLVFHNFLDVQMKGI